MSWIRVDDDVWDHHKLIRLSEALQIGQPQALGHLTSLWHYTMKHAWETADLSQLSDAWLDRAARWEPADGTFARACREAGFLDGSVVHGWSERAQPLVQWRMRKRLYDQNRTKKTRKRYRNVLVTLPERSRNALRDVTGRDSTIQQIKTTTPHYPPDFEAFWAAYPNRKGKGAAFRAWDRVKQHQALILRALPHHRDSEQWQREGGRFIPHPATWLNQRRWEDDLQQTEPADVAASLVVQEPPRELKHYRSPTYAHQETDGRTTDETP